MLKIVKIPIALKTIDTTARTQKKFCEARFCILNEIKGFLRKRVAEEVDIRYTPEIRVKLDNSMENAMKITKLLNDLKV